ncbi:MAG: hypothetical protein J6L24_04195 [Oscillospiraceae bacterium]|nr:hypothetical protein [Oscillospiraceae bacterium]
MIDEIKSVGGQVDDNGYVTLYHRTTKQAKEKILSSGKMAGKEDGIFFSTKENGQAVGYGDSVIERRIPAEKLVLDDIIDDEAHLRYLTSMICREQHMSLIIMTRLRGLFTKAAIWI